MSHGHVASHRAGKGGAHTRRGQRKARKKAYTGKHRAGPFSWII